MAIMAKNKKQLESLPSFLQHIELTLKRQNIFVWLNDDQSVERAISNAAANMASQLLDLGRAYQVGEKWPNEMRERLKGKLERGHYFNNKHKEKK
jgi:hypothetical protein